jgi:hypothetical protein
MYRSCIFCAAHLGANEAVERFPVGRTVAFDARKGRLWAVCRTCARWSLAPLEERWEAVEDAERLFRDTRLRVQSENVGLAKLPDGTRLVRVGKALPGELAAWRYGREMRSRRTWPSPATATEMLMVAAAFGEGWVFAMRAIYDEVAPYWRADRVMHRIPAAESPTGEPIHLRWRDLRLARTALGDGGRLELRIVQSREIWAPGSPVVVSGPAVAAVLGKALMRINGQGVPPADLDQALVRLSGAGGAEPFLRTTAAAGFDLQVPNLNYGSLTPTLTPNSAEQKAKAREEAARRTLPGLPRDRTRALALEMALHEVTERQAMQGELAVLKEAWRQAEEVAAIADRPPDADPPAPRLFREP